VNVDFGNLPSIHNAESIENEMPLMIESCALRTDGGGAGQFRGGVGMVRRVRLLEAEAQYSVLSDRAVIPPWGILGAGSGLPYHLSIEHDGHTFEFDTPGKVTGHPIVRDDVVVMRSSGGGGYGDPLTRDPRRVAEDVTREIISIGAARDWYGVVIAPDGRVDPEATAALRARLSAARFQLRILADDRHDPYVGRKGRHRTLELGATDAARLGAAEDSLVEMFGKHPAPLRAWARIGGIAAGAIRMDAFGRRVLGVRDGDLVYIRRVDTQTVPKGIAGSTG
jgi:N-methylhydantoinase B